LERATRLEPAPPAWESKFSFLYFQYLQNEPEKINVHALHTVHAVPDLRMTGGRLGDDLQRNNWHLTAFEKRRLFRLHKSLGFTLSIKFSPAKQVSPLQHKKWD
jgi:hypothetical protein